MASFATVADIETLLGFKFTSASSPTEAQVADLINRHSASLSILLKARGVAEPAQGTDAYEYCKLIVTYAVAADVLRRRALEEDRDVSQMAMELDRKVQELKQVLADAPQAFA